MVASAPEPARGRAWSVRRVGIVLMGAIFAESVLGILAGGAPVGSVGPALVAHLMLGGGLVVGALATVRLGVLLPSGPSKVATIATGVAVLAAASTGAAFLLAHSDSGATLDRALALAALVGAFAMVVLGEGGSGAPANAARSAL